MTKNSNSPTVPTWSGMVPVDDTALAVTDTGGAGTPVVYLNGQFATQGYWRRVIAELGTGWRHITYDERARGRSKRSADYSFEAAAEDTAGGGPIDVPAGVHEMVGEPGPGGRP